MAKTPKVSKIESFNVSTVKALMAECEVALREVAERHGLVLVRKNCRFVPDDCPVSFRLITNGTESADSDRIKGNGRDAGFISDYVRYCERYGLQKHWIGKSYDDPRHGRSTIVGLLPSSRKYPVLVEVASGKRYKFEASTVIAAMMPNEVAKAAPGSKVTWKHEWEQRGHAAGPAWFEDPANPDARLRLHPGEAGMEVVEEDPKSLRGRTIDGRETKWIDREVAKRYAASIGATFVEV